MSCFDVDFQFDDYKNYLELKKKYESASNSILVVEDSHRLKGSNDFVNSIVYDRISLACKAGTERPCKSKGIRASSTFKKQCPFKVRIGLVNNKLTVKKSYLRHENHRCDETTFKHYPENMRLKENEKEEVKKLIACGGNKQRIKADLMKNRSSPVSLKALHNLQTSERLKKAKLGPDNELEKLLENMKSIPNIIVEVVSSENGELIGIYFQDQRMVHVFNNYPEVLFFDGTHKLNSRKMPLFIQSCVDGNGDTEIASMYLCKSESKESIGPMIDIFKKHNPAWQRIKVIIGDKDFADRAIYSEKFQDATLQICLFHVMLTFNREITQYKRDLSKEQRNNALEIIQRIVYSQTEEIYESLYRQLVQLKLPKVTSYFNENWHVIREEWTLYGRNKFANYMNSTNNRLESLNGKLKLVGNRYASLNTFFENLTISVSNIESEKNITAINKDMKTPRVRFTDTILERYNSFLTPFIFKKVEEQYILKDAVKFSSIDQEKAIVESSVCYKVSHEKCSCMFFSSMKLPCRHMFQFFSRNNLELFVPNICAVRWTRRYYDDSHPVLNSSISIAATKPIFVNIVRIPEEKDRYKKAAKITSEINNISANLSTGRFTYFMEKIECLKKQMMGEPEAAQQSEASPAVVADRNDVLTVMQREFVNFLNSATQIVSPNSSITTSTTSENSDSNGSFTTESTTERLVESNLSSIKYGVPAFTVSKGTGNIQSNVLMPNVNATDDNSLFARDTQPATSSNLRRITLPSKIVSVGRPKGSKTTVIGTKRKGCKQNISVPTKKPFLQRFDDDRAVTILQWLTNMTRSDIVGKKISTSDIVGGPAIFNRLRNSDIISLRCLKKFVDSNCFEFIKSEIKRISPSPWNCETCKNELSGNQVMCSSCLDWFHFKCAGFSKSSDKDFFCQNC